ncbi:head decoration protein [Billgrantia desiderata]|uniref:head decoration protein n=1 Tax=Billgrantia desiderata TaxID=52021 RepID=UPI001F23758C|nr:head decoration protein [Halomonas desiderata]MCE8012884.1 head decoration protein [Halomonas desiderata]
MTQLDTTRAGIAAYEDGDSFSDVPLFTGERRVHTDKGIIGAEQDLAALTPLMRNAGGDLVKATAGNDVVAISMVAVTTGENETAGIPCYWSGCFNPDRLRWDESFDTEAKKMAAVGEPSVSNIAIKKMR